MVKTKILWILFVIIWILGNSISAFIPSILIGGIPALLVVWYVIFLVLGSILYLIMRKQEEK